jgi:N-acylneuraminate cytidylyltransferase
VTDVPRRVVALVPARSGSRRIEGKNVRPLRGHPLIAYTISAARRSKAFDDVVVSTDDEDTAAIARSYGASVPFLRPADLATDTSPDVDWLRHALAALRSTGQQVDAFAILRPTSPLRPAASIARAVQALLADPGADSLRAVQRVSEHPGKMWVLEGSGERMSPLLDDGGAQPPWHSTPYQALPPVFVQNASLEVAWARTVDEGDSIAGQEIRPWVSESYDGFDLNHESDWLLLERLLDLGLANLEEPDLVPEGTPAHTPTER